jgi:uncharacterized protein (DUF4415 family)
VIDVNDEDYRRDVADGAPMEHTLKPGRHIFRRGGFKERHPDFASTKKTPVKVRVNLYLDLDIVKYFKERAKSPDAAGYQTQINNALRSLINDSAVTSAEFAKLIDSKEFIEAVAERVQKRRISRPTKKHLARKSVRAAKRS